MTSLNLQNLLSGVAVIWIVAMGMTFVIVSGGLDLSVGATAALAGIFLAKLIAAGVPGAPAVAATIIFGALVGGLLNGVLIGRLGLSVFVITLASMTTLTGVVNLWSGTNSFFITSTFVTDITIGKFLGLQSSIWIMLAILLVGLYLQRRTYFGRDVFAIGGSRTAARLSGVRVPRTLISIYAISGACAGLGGIVAAGRIGAATPQVDATLPLEAIAGVLLGGTSLTGGYGSVVGTALGVLFIGVLQNGLSIAGVPSFWQQVVTGVILVVAVLGDRIGPTRGLLTRRSRSAGADEASTPHSAGPKQEQVVG